MKVKITKNKETIAGVEQFLSRLDSDSSEEEKKQHEENRKDPYLFAVTDLTFCPRRTYYKKTVDEDRDLNLKSKLRLIRGKLYDELISGNFTDSQLEVETEFDDGIRIHGRVDGIGVEGKEKYVFELKTIETLHFIENEKKPTQSALIQTKIYCAMLGIKRAKIVYFAPSDVMEFDIRFTDDELNQALQDAHSTALGINLAIRGGSLPDRQPKNHWKCRECIYKDICWGENNG